MTDAVVARLEAVAARLEATAARMGGGGGGAGADDDLPRTVEDFDMFFNDAGKPLIAAASKITETKDIAAKLTTAFNHQRTTILAASKCKKPSQGDLLKYLDPIVQIVTSGQDCDNRAPDFAYKKTFAEFLQMFNWMLMPGAATIIANTLDQADFYMVKILTAARTKPDADKQNDRDLVAAIKAFIPKFADYVKQHFRMGLVWNPTGGDLSSFSGGGGAPAAPAAPPVAPAAPAVGEIKVSATSSSSGGGGGGLGAVFAEINGKGFGGVTKGLKKVTADMKTKNRTDRPGKVPERKAAPRPAPREAKQAAVTKPPSLKCVKGTWFCENYVNDTLELKQASMKQNVYIGKSKKMTFVVAGKVKSVSLEGCHDVRIQIDSVVSVVEVINCKKIKIFVMNQAPTIQIDKSTGVSIITTAESYPNVGLINYAQSSEVLITVPGATPEDDPVEHAMPEMLQCVFGANKKPSVTIVEHHG